MNLQPRHNASDLLVASLEEEGVKYIFGIPGEENLDLLESIRQSHIQLVLTRHEQAAAIMAATCGRLTGQASVALSTLGPGATNLMTGIAFAQLGGMPMVAITGQKPIKRSKQGQFQIIDVVQTMSPITKMAVQIQSATKIPSLVREAFKLAEEERPGAVHLELPEDIACETTDETPLARIPARRPSPDMRSVRQAAEMIQNAKRPLILIAAGANRKRISTHLKEFVTKTNIPFFTTQMGKGVLDERFPGCLGTAALTSGDYVHCAIERADLIICIGHDVTEKPPAILGHKSTAKVIHIHFYRAQIDDVYFPSLEVVGDISEGLTMLTRTIQVQDSWDFSHYHTIHKETLSHIKDKNHSDRFPMLPQRIVHDLRTAIPEDGILCLDNGMYKIWVARNYPAYCQNTVLLDNALATMGTGLPSAIAAKLIYPDRPVIALCGDGGFMMNSQELETAIRLDLNLTIVIINDQGYGMIQWKQQSMGLPNYGLNFGNPDFVRYAESYGAKGHRIHNSAQLSTVLKQCLNAKGVHLIDLPVDYSENYAVLTEELKQRICLI